METYRKSRNVANRLGSSLRKSFYLQWKTRLDPADSSSWWQTIKCLLGGKKDSAAALEPLAKSTSEGNMRLLADKINDFFQSVAAHLPPLTANSPKFLSAECNVPDKYIIMVDKVESRLACLNPRKETGPDDIPTWVLWGLCTLPGQSTVCGLQQFHQGGICPRLVEACPCNPLAPKKPADTDWVWFKTSVPHTCHEQGAGTLHLQMGVQGHGTQHSPETVQRSAGQFHCTRPRRDATLHPTQLGHARPACLHAASRLLQGFWPSQP